MEEYSIGDEVLIWDKRFVVTRISDGSLLYALSPAGITMSFDYKLLQDTKSIMKTGRKYPAILDILNSLEGDEE